jgi:hypothetical protein
MGNGRPGGGKSPKLFVRQGLRILIEALFETYR